MVSENKCFRNSFTKLKPVVKTDKTSPCLISHPEEVMCKNEEKIFHLLLPIQSLAILLYRNYQVERHTCEIEMFKTVLFITNNFTG